MVLGALIDAGVPLEDVRRALGSLAITPDRSGRSGWPAPACRATKFCVRGEDPRRTRTSMRTRTGHAHHHHHHDRTTIGTITRHTQSRPCARSTRIERWRNRR